VSIAAYVFVLKVGFFKRIVATWLVANVNFPAESAVVSITYPVVNVVSALKSISV